MCKEEQQEGGDGESQPKPVVDPALVVQGTRDGKPKVDQRLVVNLKAGEPADSSAVRLVEDGASDSGDTGEDG